jgi:hypothetical protein
MNMRNINVIIGDRGFFDGEFVDYLDAFNPEDFLSLEQIQMAGTAIVPPLLRALEDQGLQAVISHDLQTVVKLHRASGGRMKRIIQTNDRRYHPNASPDDTAVLALLRDGVPQGCIASRLIWCEQTLAQEMESGRFWVENPASMWTRADRCIVRAPAAKTIRSCYVVFSGSIFLAQEVTGGNTLATMLRLHALWVLCHWRWSWLTGITEGALARRHLFDVYGLASMEMGIWRTRPGEGDELHKYEFSSIDRETAMESWLRPETGMLSRPMGRPSIATLPFEGRRVEPAEA